jgi:hypothetical protein
MTTQPPDLKKLREVAERATPGPWEIEEAVCGEHGTSTTAIYHRHNYHVYEVIETGCSCGDEAISPADADFIATFNPQTILALLDAYEASARNASTHSNSCDCDICDRARDRASLEAELEDCRTDAERYRWLRKHKWVQWEPIDGCAIQSSILDQAIDTARHATQGD